MSMVGTKAAEISVPGLLVENHLADRHLAFTMLGRHSYGPVNWSTSIFNGVCRPNGFLPRRETMNKRYEAMSKVCLLYKFH